MQLFATQLQGKTVMTRDGQILGTLAEFLVDTRSGRILNLLVAPADDVEVRLFKSDAKKRLLLPFSSLQHIKDVVVVDVPGP
jgi:sporulation protein YlmC with PRC-barrel domain